MQRIWLSGGSGFIGSRLTEQLSAAGCSVLCSPQRLEMLLDSKQHPQFIAELEGHDCVVHLAGLAHAAAARDSTQLLALNGTATETLARLAAQAGVRRFVWLSSAKVLGEHSEQPLTETAPRRPEGAYARSKADGESRLLQVQRELPMDICIVRAPLVYGPGVKANFRLLLTLADCPLPPPLAGAAAPRSWVGISNLIALLHAAIARGRGIAHAVDAQTPSVAQVLHALRTQFGRALPLWPLPAGLLRSGARLIGQRDAFAKLFNNLLLDDSLTRQQLQWQPPHSFEQQLEATVAWFRAR